MRVLSEYTKLIRKAENPRRALLERPIPACAGEPGARCAAGGLSQVDPRVCGGAVRVPHLAQGIQGRSPRMRGSRKDEGAEWAGGGSIPAYAGEPHGRGGGPDRTEVDPRVCGGAAMAAATWRSHKGRSPRMRGSLPRTRCGRRHAGLIPAYAGEPAGGEPCESGHEVDPRVCGGAIRGGLPACGNRGRSPRMRGSPHQRARARDCHGSIPAYAGEPTPTPGTSSRLRVDPRVCGGARIRAWSASGMTGRSPRMRGSPLRQWLDGIARRSIPAYAGEPASGQYLQRFHGVDPRVCGGASKI
jgi:hypothetical protein